MGSPGHCCMRRRARQPPGEPVGRRDREVAQLRHFALELGIAAASLGIGSCAAAAALGGGSWELVQQQPQRRQQQQQAKGNWTLRIPIPGWRRRRFAPLRQRQEEKGIWTFATAASLAGGGGGEKLACLPFFLFLFFLAGQEHVGLDAALLPSSPLSRSWWGDDGYLPACSHFPHK